MTLEASGNQSASAKIHYLYILLQGEALHQLEMLSVPVRSTTIANLNHVILVLGAYFSPIDVLSKLNCGMRHGMRKSCELKVRRYAAHIIKLNEYFAAFLG